MVDKIKKIKMEFYEFEANEFENLEDEEEKNISLQEPLLLDNFNLDYYCYRSDP